MPNEKIDADQLYEEVEKNVAAEKIKEKSWVNKLTPKMRVGITLVVGATLYYIVSKKIPFMKALPWIAFIIFGIYMLTQGEADPKKLTEAQTAACLYRKLKDMQRTSLGGKPRLPPGRIIVPPEGKEIWLDKKPWKRVHSFRIIDENNIPRQFSAEMNIWDGDLIGIQRRPSGFTGSEVDHIKMVWDEKIRNERERERYMNRGKR
jgi:hypothetical protein